MENAAICNQFHITYQACGRTAVDTEGADVQNRQRENGKVIAQGPGRPSAGKHPEHLRMP